MAPIIINAESAGYHFIAPDVFGTPQQVAFDMFSFLTTFSGGRFYNDGDSPSWMSEKSFNSTVQNTVLKTVLITDFGLSGMGLEYYRIEGEAAVLAGQLVLPMFTSFSLNPRETSGLYIGQHADKRVLVSEVGIDFGRYAYVNGIVFNGAEGDDHFKPNDFGAMSFWTRSDTSMASMIADGAGGDDTLVSGSGGDILYGGEGNDHLEGMGGDDTISGGVGDDSVGGGDGDDVIVGDEGNDYLFGGEGHDRLDGGIGDDTLESRQGNDLLLGRGGNDKLWGQWGNDRVSGGGGDDEITGGDGEDKLIGGTGTDTIWGNDGNDVIVGGAGKDILGGSAGDDEVNGGVGADRLEGWDGNDILIGGAGNDWLTGNWQDDALFGEVGLDKLYGGDGDDRLVGGANSDTTEGGDGADTFAFSSLLDGRDTISDFSSAEGDRIEISAAGFGAGLVLGNLGPSLLPSISRPRWTNDSFSMKPHIGCFSMLMAAVEIVRN